MLVNKYYNVIVSTALMETVTAAAVVAAAYADAIALGPTAGALVSSIGPTAVKSISMQIYATRPLAWYYNK